MSDTLTIELPEAVAREIERAARASGQTNEAFVAEAAARYARGLIEAEAFFAERASGADFEAFDEIMNRGGGKPPRAGDEVE